MDKQEVNKNEETKQCDIHVVMQKKFTKNVERGTALDWSMLD